MSEQQESMNVKPDTGADFIKLSATTSIIQGTNIVIRCNNKKAYGVIIYNFCYMRYDVLALVRGEWKFLGNVKGTGKSDKATATNWISYATGIS